MAQFSMTCPYCLQDRSTFSVSGLSQAERELYVAGSCARCRRLAVLLLEVHSQAQEARTIAGMFQGPKDAGYVNLDTLKIASTIPALPRYGAPIATPVAVERSWIEAEKSRRSEAHVAATMMYRLTLETALEAVYPSEGRKPKLFDAINAAADAQKITPDLRDWAHHIRLVGNEAAHEGGSPAEIAELANLTEMVLVYLFELPDKVRRMREAAEAKKAAATP